MSKSVDFNDPIVFQLIKNCFENATTLTPDFVQFCLSVQTNQIFNEEDLAAVFDSFKKHLEKYPVSKTTKISKVVPIKEYGVQIDIPQIRMFFFHIRCYSFYLNFLVQTSLFNPFTISFALNGMASVTQKFADFLQSIEKETFKTDNLVEKWFENGLKIDIQESDIIGVYFPFTKFNVISVKNMAKIFYQIQLDVEDVLKKLESKIGTRSLTSWEAPLIFIIICQLAKQVHDVVSAGVNEADNKLSLLLSSHHFGIIMENLK